MSEDLSRVEIYCPDPACDWTLIETPDGRGVPQPVVAWQGSVGATVRAVVEVTAAHHRQLLDLACETHIREAHDPHDPRGWAERTIAARSTGTGDEPTEEAP